jgi:riboflavin synthase
VFTGIVTGIGKVERVEPQPGGSRRLTLTTGLDLSGLALGASVAVSGVCLTVVRKRARGFLADLGPETLALTTLGDLSPGDRVHLERALRVGDELGGHLVSGHVDGVGRVAGRRPQGDALTLRIAAPAAVAPFLARKGSVTVDGVSLTVNDVSGSVFSVTLIPHTLAVTCLGERQRSDRVNIEADLIAKHVARLAERQRQLT